MPATGAKAGRGKGRVQQGPMQATCKKMFKPDGKGLDSWQFMFDTLSLLVLSSSTW